VQLFLRLNADVNERLQALMRYQGELSRHIDEALTLTDVRHLHLIPARPARADSCGFSSRQFGIAVCCARAGLLDNGPGKQRNKPLVSP
jgi:hypothetical protein